jgi:hypothetical protein
MPLISGDADESVPWIRSRFRNGERDTGDVEAPHPDLNCGTENAMVVFFSFVDARYSS